ncbi:hypothetical protein CEE37_07290 [candidate division LCP-89 bacterium B3_LCP]|uniref:4Fe-4S ferredoxin-type domain-containing protein n=1 Tax=candidate division LCP-89 bacterium B3_LCP TaxID=2012998 RepID=A0A532V0P4_UNCL8|nr:MAG: hypothetical protein CEE37_07290 [candidate division LCP-89 bacterium B3_LCP]
MSQNKENIPLAPCINSCPQGIDIRAFIGDISQAENRGMTEEEAFEKAWRKITEVNPFPAVCGRVCPHPCEGECNRQERDSSVNINVIERFLGDWAIDKSLSHQKLTDRVQSEKIAIIGSGPAGLSCAYQLARRGYKSTIFEALSEPGGMLRYGIPSFRLPRDVLSAEIEKILDLGVELRTNCAVGKDISFDEIRTEHDAVFLGIGAQKAVMLHCPGEETSGVYNGLEFLESVNSGEKIDLGNSVAVIGGGNTAIDAARVAKRLGAKVTIVYRRTREEMPALAEEIEAAEEERIEIVYLAAPLEVQSENERVSSILCQRMELGEPDDSGRRKPVPIPDDTFTLSVDNVIVAVSQQPEWEGLENIRVSMVWAEIDQNGFTEHDGIFAGGDVQGIGIVAEALNQGRRAAEAIHAELSGDESPVRDTDREIIRADQLNLYVLEESQRCRVPGLNAEQRLKEPWSESNFTPLKETIVKEADRCVTCGESFIKAPKRSKLHILRRVTQIGVGTLLFNSFWGVISTKMVYGGPLRNACVPGLNCHSCPTALMGCPIGMLQHFSATHRIPWFLIGFLGIIGLISGRFTCGWLCPWGLIQDLLNRFKKLTIPLPRILDFFKYAVLIGVVIIIPYYTYEHWFSKLCPCGALIAGIPWVLWNPIDPEIGISVIDPADIGTLFTIKMWILGIFLLLFLFIKRPFCRVFCPLGAIYALFNRISLVSIEVDPACASCGQCPAACPANLVVETEANSEECIKCLECTECQHVRFVWNWPWRKKRKSFQL